MAICLSSGPIELDPNSALLFAKILNNSQSSVTAQVRIFSLNGTKQLFEESETFTIEPGASDFFTSVIFGLAQIEVQICLSSRDDVFVGAFVKDFGGHIIAGNVVKNNEFFPVTTTNFSPVQTVSAQRKIAGLKLRKVIATKKKR